MYSVRLLCKMFSLNGEHIENIETVKRILDISTDEVKYLVESLHRLNPDVMVRRNQIHRLGQHILHKYFQPSVPMYFGRPIDTTDVRWSKCPQPFSIPLYPYQLKALTGMLLSECLATNHAYFGKCIYAPDNIQTCISMMAVSGNPYRAVGGLLDMDVGTGKTPISLGVVALTLPECTRWMSQQPNRGGTLILAPPQLVRQWREEIKKFCPHLKLSYQYGQTSTGIDNYHIILSSYKTYQQRKKNFENKEFFRIIFDEGQIITDKTFSLDVCESTKAIRRWVLSATPLTGSLNMLIPYYHILHIFGDVLETRHVGYCINKNWIQLNVTEGSDNLDLKHIFDDRNSIAVIDQCIVKNLSSAYLLFSYLRSRTRPYREEFRYAVGCCATLAALSSVFLNFSSEGCAASKICVHEQSYYIDLPLDYLHFLNNMRENYYWDSRRILSLVRLALSIVATADTFQEAADEYTKRERSAQLENLGEIEYETLLATESIPERCRNSIQYAVTEGTDCCICMDALEDIVITHPCFHIFCKKCALQWSRVRVTCPLCRKKMTNLVEVENPKSIEISKEVLPPPPQVEICLTPRVIAALDYIRQIEDDSNILVFVEFPLVGRTIANILSHEYSVGIVTGSTKMSAKHRTIENFQNGKLHILILTYPISSVGLNITRANHVVFIEPPETRVIKKQAAGRAIRDGQERDVTVATFYAKNTFECNYPQIMRTDSLPRRIYINR